MENKKKFYVTTPIYYPSSDLHIGHTYTTVAADTMNRFRRLQGYDSYFITGTDEHGQKIEKIAEENNVTPKEYVDGVVERIKKLWKVMNIDYNQFIRTTDEQHMKTIQGIFRKLYEQGDIYKGKYEGLYCTPCESFWTESQAPDGVCPDCGRKLSHASEEAYFFKMSKYADRLLKHINDHPEFIQPEARKNEMINNFIKPGLQDLCVSRTSFSWGVPVDFDPGHVVYVWIDALPNYLSALGYMNEKQNLMDTYWAPDVQLVGKDIIRFHTIYWPIMLMALDLPLPKTVYGHGWILLKEGKMSKSLGNVIDPVVLVEKYGVDALRYYILREMNFGGDSAYSEDLLISRINSDLANDLGNLLNRTTAMAVKYFDGKIPSNRESASTDQELINLAQAAPEVVNQYMDKVDYAKALESIWKLVSRTNKYIDETQPWILCKEEATKARLAQVMYNLSESLRIVGVLVGPFLPDAGQKILDALKIPECYRSWESILSFGQYSFEEPYEKCVPLFPRIEVEKAGKDQNIKDQNIKGQNIKGHKTKDQKTKDQKTTEEKINNQNAEAVQSVKKDHTTAKALADTKITIDDFAKVKLEIGTVIQCEKHPKADRLLVFQVDLGREVRQIISGIAAYYTPEELVGKRVLVCVNLKKVKLRGLESNGMILSALDGEKLSLMTLDKDIIADGSEVR